MEGGSPGGGKPWPFSEEASNLEGDKGNQKRFDSSFIFKTFPPAALTNIGSHLPERSRSVGADGGRRVVGRLLQVGQAGSQPLAQPVVGAGVASVASPGKIIHERTSRKICHGMFPVETTRRRQSLCWRVGEIGYSTFKWVKGCLYFSIFIQTNWHVNGACCAINPDDSYLQLDDTDYMSHIYMYAVKSHAQIHLFRVKLTEIDVSLIQKGAVLPVFLETLFDCSSFT